jgi:hypothetical protein
VYGIDFEQIAIKVGDSESWSKMLGRLGPTNWVHDKVTAINLYRSWIDEESVISAFQVGLAFNYSIIPGKEFELISLHQGRSCQFDRRELSRGLSHFGYHVADESENPKGLDEAIEFWAERGHPCLQVAQTIEHTGTDARYRYAFVDTNSVFGAPVKIIQRLDAEPPENVLECLHSFDWVRGKGVSHAIPGA